MTRELPEDGPRPTPQEAARWRDNLPPLPTGRMHDKWQKQVVKDRRERQVTRRSKAEYDAAAMLLGMRYSKVSHTFYCKSNEVGGYDTLKFYHPDTLKPITVEETRIRRNKIQLHGNAEYEFNPSSDVFARGAKVSQRQTSKEHIND